MIVRNKAHLDAFGLPDMDMLRGILQERDRDLSRMRKLRRVYEMHHDVERRQRESGAPNAIMQHDFPGYIVSVASGYLLGEAVRYEGEQIEQLTQIFAENDVDSVDQELAEHASVYGRGVEIIYTDEQSEIRSAALDPMEAFVVYDDTVQRAPMLGVRVVPLLNALGRRTGWAVDVYGETMTAHYEGATMGALHRTHEPAAHNFSGVPIVEYWNNDREEGDFERVITLIDGYDSVESDRANDKQQFTNAFLALTGASGIAEDDDDESAAHTGTGRVLALPDGSARAEWIVKPAVEADTQILAKAIAADIHKFSGIPDMSDENFAGNTSGVAMEYKLFGLKQLTRRKERWFREGLRTRIRRYSEYLYILHGARIDPAKVRIVFTRGMPVNNLELAQTLGALSNIVPTRQLLEQVPFVENAQESYDALMEESRARARDSYLPYTGMSDG